LKLFFSKLLAGFVIGAGAIIPGLSGGILAVSMGIYQKTIEAVTGFFKAPKKNFRFLLPLIIGGGIGWLVFMFLIDKTFAKYQTEVISIFLGLVVGSIPSFISEANDGKPFKPTSLVYTLIGFAFAFALVLCSLFMGDTAVGAQREMTPLLALVCGAVVMFGVVTPGVSTSFIIINMNCYNSFLNVFAHFFDDPGKNLVFAGFTALGFLLVAVPMLLLARTMLRKFHRQSFYFLFGFLLATLVGCIIQESIRPRTEALTALNIAIIAVLFIVGAVISFVMERAMKKMELHEAEENAEAGEDAGKPAEVLEELEELKTGDVKPETEKPAENK
jgi:Predicted membrane protein